MDNSKTGSNIKESEPTTPKKPVKPPKLEDKPFEEFIVEDLIPTLSEAIKTKTGEIITLDFVNTKIYKRKKRLQFVSQLK